MQVPVADYGHTVRSKAPSKHLSRQQAVDAEQEQEQKEQEREQGYIAELTN